MSIQGPTATSCSGTLPTRWGSKIAVVEFPERYNGNIRVVMARGAAGHADGPDESGFEGLLSTLAERAQHYRDHGKSAFQALSAKHGRLPAKAFPGRASILLALAGIDEDEIEACYERPASPKIGNYIPGTRIPILSEDRFFADPKAPVLVNFAWHISREIENYLRLNGYRGQIVDLYPA